MFPLIALGIAGGIVVGMLIMSGIRPSVKTAFVVVDDEGDVVGVYSNFLRANDFMNLRKRDGEMSYLFEARMNTPNAKLLCETSGQE